jgi:hypothetical protein
VNTIFLVLGSWFLDSELAAEPDQTELRPPHSLVKRILLELR